MEEASYVADYITNGGDKVRYNRAHSSKSTQHYATSNILVYVSQSNPALLYFQLRVNRFIPFRTVPYVLHRNAIYCTALCMYCTVLQYATTVKIKYHSPSYALPRLIITIAIILTCRKSS